MSQPAMTWRTPICRCVGHHSKSRATRPIRRLAAAAACVRGPATGSWSMSERITASITTSDAGDMLWCAASWGHLERQWAAAIAAVEDLAAAQEPARVVTPAHSTRAEHQNRRTCSASGQAPDVLVTRLLGADIEHADLVKSRSACFS